jgi:hypothetical protein
VVDPASSAYSALVSLASGRLGLLYEMQVNASLIFQPDHILYTAVDVDTARR